MKSSYILIRSKCLHLRLTLLFTDPAKSSCIKDPSKCWCVSAGGNTCGYGNNEQCDPDECDDRTECPGYGYWCEDAGNIFLSQI